MAPKKFIPKGERAAHKAAEAEAAAALAAKTSSLTLSGPTAEEAASSELSSKGPVYGGAESASARTCTGLLTSEPRSRDVKISSFALSLHGKVLVEDTEIELTAGQRYGLIGRNGCGKSTLLRCLANREVPIPTHIDTYLLAEEAQPSEQTAMQYVISSAQDEVVRLEALAERLLEESGPDSPALEAVYDRQSELDPSTFESRASLILVGLGFDPVTVHKKTKDMSGGWRMRVALARALFISPSLLLLDEPTNHLDLEACVWLEDYLSRYNKCLIVISHSQDFLNGVCTRMMVMQARKLRYWGGNYDQYVTTRTEQDKNQLTQYQKQQEEIADIKQFIASCGTYANLVRQAKSREKKLDKMIADGLIEMPFADPIFRFSFPDTGKLPPPLISFSDVAFSYSGKKEDYLFTKLSFGVDSDSRIALVGPNGAGKSTLLKLMVRENHPSEGTVNIKSGLVLGRYHQHSHEVLDNAATPVEYISKRFHEAYPEKKPEDWRECGGGVGGRFADPLFFTPPAVCTRAPHPARPAARYSPPSLPPPPPQAAS